MLKLLIEDPVLRARMGAAALERARAEFHIARTADRYLRLYRGHDTAV